VVAESSAASLETVARLTTTPASGMPSACRRSTKKPASRTASGSGAATTTKLVPAPASSA
jgi:hypothetical protein